MSSTQAPQSTLGQALTPTITTSHVDCTDGNGFNSPANIKEEPSVTPRFGSPANPIETDPHSLKPPASNRSEHGTHTQSPLRETSTPVPSTEMAPPDTNNPKKRPAPVRNKKGMATATKKEPAAKKRKLEVKRSGTPLSATSKSGARKVSSGKGTPLNSSPAPSTRTASVEPDRESEEEEDDGDGEDIDDDNLYCICRKPDTGTFMIGCDGKCDDWFHGKCMGIAERDKNLIDKYICPKCTKAGVGMTTWKRMCRRPGCRQAARVGKKRGGPGGSKYCSDDCGVQFFQSLTTRTRDGMDAGRPRGSRRKNDASREQNDDDLGPRGGVLATGEVKGLLDAANSAEEFRKLGDGVLSPPSTPNSKTNGSSISFTDAEVEAMAEIATKKNDARRRHQLLKDRLTFATLAKQAATRVAAERELKAKEYCGYDSRIEWTEEEFALWRDSDAGQQAFATNTLTPEQSSVSTGTSAETGEEVTICDRRKCARHLEWNKLAVDDVRHEMSDNSDNMRALDRDERAIKERAALRGRDAHDDAISGGRVEVHDLMGSEAIQNGGSGDEMDIDAMPTPAPEQVTLVTAMESVDPPGLLVNGGSARADVEVDSLEADVMQV